jgi:hypothetical protein
MTLMTSKFRYLLPCALGILVAGCAPLTVPPQAEYPAGRARLVLPPGAWQDLGSTDEPRAALQMRSVGLRGAQGEWLAVLRVQTNRTGALAGFPLGPGDCPRQQNVMVTDPAANSPVRADCLRLKNWGTDAQWLEKNRPDLVQWLGSRQIALKPPYTYLSYRYATQAGAWVAVEAVVDQRLLSTRARTNEEFLLAGLPAEQWSRDLAQAARLSVGMADGYLAVPAFPFAEAAARK